MILLRNIPFQHCTNISYVFIYNVCGYLIFLLYSLLISYTRDKGNPDEKWKGYVYGVAMFLVAMIISIVIHQYFQIVFVLGMRIRTALIGMVYAKVHK